MTDVAAPAWVNLDNVLSELDREINKRVYVDANIGLEDALYLLGGAMFVAKGMRDRDDRLWQAARTLVAAAKGWARANSDPVPEDERRAYVHALAEAIDAFDPMLAETTPALDLDNLTDSPPVIYEAYEDDRNRLLNIVTNTATDVRILVKALGNRNDVAVGALVTQIYERLMPFDVGESTDD